MNVHEDVRKRDKKFFGRGKPVMELEVTKVKGSFIYDAEGKEYVDFLGGAGVGNLGWDKEEIENVLRKNDRPSYVYPNFYYKPWTELAEILANITPGELSKSFRVTGGSEAVDASLLIAMMYTGRKKFLSLEGSYHGNTIGALSVASSSNRKKFPNLLSECEKIETPLNEEALNKVEDQLKNNEVAAFIMEPIVSNLGVIIPKEKFMSKLAEICKTHGTLLIMDEAVTGFGRTGKLFATEYYDIKPDIMIMAKALSAGHEGIGAVITTPEVAEKVEGKVGLYSSYGWHPTSTDVAIKTMHYILKNKDKIFKNISDKSEIFEEELSKIDFGKEIELRIKGLTIGIDVKDEEFASKIQESCLKHGLLINIQGSSLVLFPPMNIDSLTVTKGIDLLNKSVQNLHT
ncbi:aspartate aminotransferase family protein, partial [Salegentibacter sp. F188]